MPGPFDRLPHDANGHFRLWFYAALLALREGLPPTARQLPFVLGYESELAAAGIDDLERWLDAIAAWESDSELPLTALRRAARLSRHDVVLLFLIGLSEEDPGFGALTETLLGPGRLRLTVGLAQRFLAPEAVRAGVTRLRALEAIHVTDATLPRPAWELAVEPAVWDALQARAPELAPTSVWHAREALPELSALILEPALAARARRIARAFGEDAARTLLVRGAEHGGRRTLVRAIARELGRGTLELSGPEPGVGVVAELLGALPVHMLDPGPGETVPLPPLPGYTGPRAAVLGRQGGVGGAVDGAIILDLGIPSREVRRRHWTAALGGRPPQAVVEHYRMTAGHIRRAAALAQAGAAVAGRTRPNADDVRLATRTLHGQLLDTLAARLPSAGGWEELVVAAEVERELMLLERRCHAREELAQRGGPAQPGAGVRALLTGASGTGKTLAARVLASRLGLDAYRLDLASVVDKYLGETEKNLERALSHAEAANAVLLLDEGDALLTRRTAVQTANDRYANLETNFLLQRLESFEGILLVTTNAAERVDGAFRRRMDVIVDFRGPEAPERLRILALHLPDAHAVDDAVLRTVAVRCTLTGGQLRNAVLHAELLALEADQPVTSEHLDTAIRREYRQNGARCPLPAFDPAIGGA